MGSITGTHRWQAVGATINESANHLQQFLRCVLPHRCLPDETVNFIHPYSQFMFVPGNCNRWKLTELLRGGDLMINVPSDLRGAA